MKTVAIALCVMAFLALILLTVAYRREARRRWVKSGEDQVRYLAVAVERDALEADVRRLRDAAEAYQRLLHDADASAAELARYAAERIRPETAMRRAREWMPRRSRYSAVMAAEYAARAAMDGAK